MVFKKFWGAISPNETQKKQPVTQVITTSLPSNIHFKENVYRALFRVNPRSASLQTVGVVFYTIQKGHHGGNKPSLVHIQGDGRCLFFDPETLQDYANMHDLEALAQTREHVAKAPLFLVASSAQLERTLRGTLAEQPHSDRRAILVNLVSESLKAKSGETLPPGMRHITVADLHNYNINVAALHAFINPLSDHFGNERTISDHATHAALSQQIPQEQQPISSPQGAAITGPLANLPLELAPLGTPLGDEAAQLAGSQSAGRQAAEWQIPKGSALEALRASQQDRTYPSPEGSEEDKPYAIDLVPPAQAPNGPER